MHRYTWLWMGLFFILVLLCLLLFIPLSWHQIYARALWDHLYLCYGEENAFFVQQYSDLLYIKYFEQTSFRYHLLHYFIPSEIEKGHSKGMTHLGTDWFSWMSQRLLSFIAALKNSLANFVLVLIWLPFSVLILVTLLVEGIMHRYKQQYTFYYTSTVIYHFAIKFVLFSLILMVLLIVLPIKLAFYLIPIFLIFIPFLLMCILIHAPKKI